jgi:hypothetical protein
VPHLLKGGFTENASTKVDVYSVRQPLGPVGIISPFNFPAMVPMWFFPIAIAAGNTVVLKPSEKDPSASLWIAELWAEAGLPPGVFNVLQGDKTAVDELLTTLPCSLVMILASSSLRALRSSRTANNTAERLANDVSRQAGNAAAAASITARASSTLPNTTSPVTAPVAGLVTGALAALVPAKTVLFIQWLMLVGILFLSFGPPGWVLCW